MLCCNTSMFSILNVYQYKQIYLQTESWVKIKFLISALELPMISILQQYTVLSRGQFQCIDPIFPVRFLRYMYSIYPTKVQVYLSEYSGICFGKIGPEILCLRPLDCQTDALSTTLRRLIHKTYIFGIQKQQIWSLHLKACIF